MSAPKENRLGLARTDYTGGKSTLCTGCGHDSITNNIVSSFFLSGIHPHKVIKLSGIGCSSKTPAYFLNKSFGFNSLHGRMAPVATGAKVVNQELTAFGVSGDGDSASIGLGGFAHLVRRNLPMVYIVENNGVYGLTKGQFSATASKDSTLKNGQQNSFENIDLCSMAIDLGCSFVARSFSGDSKQLVPLLQAALKHPGTAVIDIISPCVTFNNHEGSTLSYNAVKEHNIALQQLGFIPSFEEKTADYEEGEVQEITMHDGSILTLRKLDSRTHDLKNAGETLKMLRESRQKGELLTGLFYLDGEAQNLFDSLGLCEKPLTELADEELRPKLGQLPEIMNQFR